MKIIYTQFALSIDAFKYKLDLGSISSTFTRELVVETCMHKHNSFVRDTKNYWSHGKQKSDPSEKKIRE